MGQRGRWAVLLAALLAAILFVVLGSPAYPVRLVGEKPARGAWQVRLYSGPLRAGAWTATEIWQTAPDGLQFRSIDGATWRISGTWTCEEVRP